MNFSSSRRNQFFPAIFAGLLLITTACNSAIDSQSGTPLTESAALTQAAAPDITKSSALADTDVPLGAVAQSSGLAVLPQDSCVIDADCATGARCSAQTDPPQCVAGKREALGPLGQSPPPLGLFDVAPSEASK